MIAGYGEKGVKEMNYETLELSSEIVSAYCSNNNLSTSELVSLIKEVASVLAELKEPAPPKTEQ